MTIGFYQEWQIWDMFLSISEWTLFIVPKLPPSEETEMTSEHLLVTIILSALAHETSLFTFSAADRVREAQFNIPPPPCNMTKVRLRRQKRQDFPEVAITCGMGQCVVMSLRTDAPVHTSPSTGRPCTFWTENMNVF